jgi:hypothetical protein
VTRQFFLILAVRVIADHPNCYGCVTQSSLFDVCSPREYRINWVLRFNDDVTTKLSIWPCIAKWAWNSGIKDNTVQIQAQVQQSSM